jgi:hypothetical protein
MTGRFSRDVGLAVTVGEQTYEGQVQLKYNGKAAVTTSEATLRQVSQ